MRRSSFYWLFLIFTFSSCDLINPEEPVPSYLYLDSPTLTTSAGEGSASHNITEYWVFIDDEYIGAFPVPATIPILKTGSVEVRVEAGIRDNGLTATPDIYPFYTPYRQNMELETGITKTAQPTFRYSDDTDFAFIENFDQGNNIFGEVVTGTSQSKLQNNSEAPFEGAGSGLIQLTTTDPYVEFATNSRFRDLLKDGNAVYLEVNYRSDVPVSFGILGYNLNGADPTVLAYQAGFNPSESWKKIYFNLTSVVFSSEADEFKIILQAAIPLDENNNFALDQAQVFLDNIKLVHF